MEELENQIRKLVPEVNSLRSPNCGLCGRPLIPPLADFHGVSAHAQCVEKECDSSELLERATAFQRITEQLKQTITAIASRDARDHPLVSLFGPPGLGKTSIGRQSSFLGVNLEGHTFLHTTLDFSNGDRIVDNLQGPQLESAFAVRILARLIFRYNHDALNLKLYSLGEHDLRSFFTNGLTISRALELVRRLSGVEAGGRVACMLHLDEVNCLIDDHFQHLLRALNAWVFDADGPPMASRSGLALLPMVTGTATLARQIRFTGGWTVVDLSAAVRPLSEQASFDLVLKVCDNENFRLLWRGFAPFQRAIRATGGLPRILVYEVTACEFVV